MFSEKSKNRYYKTKNLWYKLRLLIAGIQEQPFDDNLLKDKRVIILGPAESSLKYMSGPEIDEFDVVVRMNNAPFSLKGKEKFLGSRTDLLFHCCFEDPIGGGGKIIPEVLFEQHLKQIIYPYDEISIIANYYRLMLKYRNLKFAKLPKRFYWELKKQYKGRIPTTGLQTLHYLMQSDCSELHITGFTFFTTPYIEGYKPDAYRSAAKAYELAVSSSTHDPVDELRLFKEIYFKMDAKKIFLDETLIQIVGQP
ncbi:MAG: glycosyltransferase family 29 protein [Candidatus Marinimicrobia bacterium]|nr:glycosyltransferase family 29 protein [Candidatus Neomarinimicrobiota bacterium]